MEKIRILVVEDEPDQLKLITGILRMDGHDVTGVSSSEQALEHLNKAGIDLILSDWKLPGKNGLEFLEIIRNEFADIAFIMITAYGSISRAVDAVRSGADDYLTKPFERQALVLAIDRAFTSRKLLIENRRLTEALGERDRLVELVGSAPSMQKLFRTVEKLAATNATVLISGESGTGKELTARALHTLSKRSEKPFIAVNCAAIPEGLLESEFFGSEKGAFTGADRLRYGKFEAADNGTLFFDEIGELPMHIQPKLLRVLQDSKFTRVGGTKEFCVDVRIIAATNRDLDQQVKEGRFREDLYYRLNVVPVRLPPLRERKEDIPRLIEFFITKSCRKHGLNVDQFPNQVLKKMMDYHWPGNVRELSNAVERLILFSDQGKISTEDLPRHISEVPLSDLEFKIPENGMSWEKHEKQCLQQALDLSHGNKAKAARLLSLPYKAFLYRMEKFGLE